MRPEQAIAESAERASLDDAVWLTPRQVARRFQLDEALVQRLIARGKLDAVRFEGESRISPEAVASYCARFTVPKRARAIWAIAAIAALSSGMLVTSGILYAQSTPARGSFVVPYQGYLEEDGRPAEGDKFVTFGLFGSAEGGTPIWTEVHAVHFSTGRFTANLGETRSLDDVMRTNSSLYLELDVDGVDGGAAAGNAVPLAGRQLFGAVPFARRGAPGKDFVVDGRLGVGTTIPSAPLEVAGGARVNGEVEVGSSTRGAILSSSAPDNFQLKTWLSSPNPNFDIGAGNSAGGFAWRWISAEGTNKNLFLARDGGNVGIGTINPVARLDVEGDARVTGTIRGASWGFGGLFSTGDCPSSNYAPNPLTGAQNCPPGFTSYFVARFRMAEPECGAYIFVCIK